eukprot:GEZU01039832.1.p1 GENE.GEZU01039832.1~~GEZU01039832.1.p1  ORF type:complete len:105 (+),score=4.13 GEZU01039832.1:73-387(+)
MDNERYSLFFFLGGKEQAGKQLAASFAHTNEPVVYNIVLLFLHTAVARQAELSVVICVSLSLSTFHSPSTTKHARTLLIDLATCCFRKRTQLVVAEEKNGRRTS